MSKSKPLVLKFGGSSVRSISGFKSTLKIISQLREHNELVVVVSAFRGVTDLLIRFTKNELDSSEAETLLRKEYFHVGRSILHPEWFFQFTADFEKLIYPLAEYGETRDWSDDQKAEVIAIGELASVLLLDHALKERRVSCIRLDPRLIIRAVEAGLKSDVDYAETSRLSNTWYDSTQERTVRITAGYFASNPEGRTSLLGRGGSDLSASVIARSLNSPALLRWTDVDGVYTSDPRNDDDAVVIPNLTFKDALKKTQEGHSGLQRRSLDPLIGQNIPIHIGSTFEPELPGTWIDGDHESEAKKPRSKFPFLQVAAGL